MNANSNWGSPDPGTTSTKAHSAYIFIGGLHFDLTEGDVITIFSQYGEVMDVNLPRDKTTGKTRGFGFLMYEDQRSTVLAVDNLNGAKVLEKTLRVDHVKDYKQPRVKGADGDWEEPEEQSLNARPEMVIENESASDSDASSAPSIDPEDPMRDYLLAQRKEAKALKKAKGSKGKHKNETPEERKARKERKKEKKAKKLKSKSNGMRGVEDLLKNLGGRDIRPRSRTPTRRRRSSLSRSRSPVSRPQDTRMRSRSPDTHSNNSGTGRSTYQDNEYKGSRREPYSRSRKDRD
ncbi:hypothetical protein BV22DRAFT_1190479 [Leucogyrophana mollusca]|uniref:Uncharacterized protein n=1 Tax=Leucogyrophana mollusca TaxID=85980 RepID=A0ACB8BZJ1_9AGAM|nr:hypothetical protein BV22DRAFT_1190479 [Leucogyrophana mollusca]